MDGDHSEDPLNPNWNNVKDGINMPQTRIADWLLSYCSYWMSMPWQLACSSRRGQLRPTEFNLQVKLCQPVPANRGKSLEYKQIFGVRQNLPKLLTMFLGSQGNSSMSKWWCSFTRDTHVTQELLIGAQNLHFISMKFNQFGLWTCWKMRMGGEIIHGWTQPWLGLPLCGPWFRKFRHLMNSPSDTPGMSWTQIAKQTFA